MSKQPIVTDISQITVTVVGKIELPEYKQFVKEKAERKVKHGSFHFRERLFERYGINLTIEEYAKICDLPLKNAIKVDANATRGYIEIKGVNVLVVKHKKRQLITALPFK
jgi:hypothetical protein